MTLRVREFEPDDVRTGLRPADEEECFAAGMSAEQALWTSVHRSDHAFVHEVGGAPVALWGYRVDNMLTMRASMWMLSTPLVDSHRVAFARESRRLVERLLGQFTSITVTVYCEHQQARRWLEWLGFTVAGARRIGGASFLQMQKERN